MTTRRPFFWRPPLSLAGSTWDGSSRPNSNESNPICLTLSISFSPSSSVVKGEVHTQALTPIPMAMSQASFDSRVVCWGDRLQPGGSQVTRGEIEPRSHEGHEAILKCRAGLPNVASIEEPGQK